MKTDAFAVVRQFEAALCEYTGAPFAVTTSSCTMALLLATRYCIENAAWPPPERPPHRPAISIPKRTYVSVPMSIIHAGGRPTFRDEDWHGQYQLKPLLVFDAARRFTRGMYQGATVYEYAGGPVRATLRADPGTMVCVSFHWSKILGIQQGGAILHNDPEADAWLRRARFDGRTEGVPPIDDRFNMLGWHAYMSPEIAAEGLMRIGLLPDNIPDLPNDNYPDLSTMEIFR